MVAFALAQSLAISALASIMPKLPSEVLESLYTR